MIKILSFNINNALIGAEVIKRGGVIVYPTDTVYGIGGDPFREETVNRVIKLKGRRVKPFPILTSNINYVLRLANIRSKSILELLNRIWPGSVTVILQSKRYLPEILGGKYVGLRIPNEPILIKMIENIGGFLIGTSANISGEPPAQNVNQAISYFADKVDLYLDGGDRKGKPSTVIKIINEKVKLIRIGANIDKVLFHLKNLGFKIVGEEYEV